MIRINVNVTVPPYYSIPADNPFVNDSTVKDEIWDIGFRNAWRWSFDRANGDWWIVDVGQDSMEEVNYKTAAQGGGYNFGWQCYEGTQPFKTSGCRNINKYAFPIFEYHHDIPSGGECLIGGYVYRGTSYPALQGYFVCADYYSGNAWEIKPNGSGGWNSYIQTGVPKGISSFGEDEAAESYAVSWQTGVLYSIQANSAITLLNDNNEQSNLKAVHKYMPAAALEIYPNPFSNSTTISYTLLQSQKVSVSIYDVTGNFIKTLLNTQVNEGAHQLTWNAKDEKGKAVNAGVYFLQFVTGEYTKTKKLIVVK